MNPVILIFSVGTILIGFFILIRAFLHFRRGLDRKDWPSTVGEILASELRKVTGHNGAQYHPDIRYRYKVNLVEYESNVIAASAPPFVLGSHKYASTLVNQYQAHNKVNVYYNPDNPEKAVLERAISPSGMLLLLFLGIAILACGLAPWILMM